MPFRSERSLGEPMDLAWRLLKDDEKPPPNFGIPDYTKLNRQMMQFYPEGFDYDPSVMFPRECKQCGADIENFSEGIPINENEGICTNCLHPEKVDFDFDRSMALPEVEKPKFDDDFSSKYASEPMDLAWRLLKNSNYRQAAGAIIRDSEGRVLLMRRSPLETSMHGMYELPGGKLEEGETPEDAARIEALEESGLPIVNLQALNPHVDHGMEKIYHGFTADIDPQHEGDVVRSDEHDNHMWIHPQEALNMQGHPDGMDVPFLSHHAANLFEQMVG